MTGCAASHFFSSCVRSTSAGALVGPAAAIAQTAIAPAARQAAATGAINRRLRAHNALTGTSPLKPQVMRNCLPISSPPEDRRCSQAHQEVLECVTSSPAARSDGMKIQLFSDLHLEPSARRSANVRLLDNDELTIDGVRFLGSTLWTDFALLGRQKMGQVIAESLKYV